VSIAARYPSQHSVLTKGWERLCWGAAVSLLVLALFGVVTTGELIMAAAAVPFVASFVGVALICRARRIKHGQARDAFVAELKAVPHG